MNPNIKDIRGERFGKLVVKAHAGSNSRRNSLWLCECDCGKTHTVVRNSLTSGHTKSCGCLHSTVNGDASGNQAPEYTAWAGMIQRCENKNGRNWHNYGGRGITVCKEWRNDYNQFLSDMGRRPTKKHSLDRRDNDCGYFKENCRWATAKTQVNNRRRVPKKSWRQAAKHAYRVVKSFEDVLASYTGAKYAITVDSCTDAILFCCEYLEVSEVEIPKYTYCSVPMSIIHAGGKVKFRDEDWLGYYKLEPYPIYDSARLMTSDMYIPSTLMTLSFHWSKHLPIGRGGAILCDDKKAADWFKRFRFDGRKESVSPKNDSDLIIGRHSYMTPTYAAQGLMLMASIKEHNDPLPNDDYPDLSKMEIFK